MLPGSRFIATVFFAAGLLLPVASLAQGINAPPGRWTADYGTTRCSLARRIAGPQSPILILTYNMGREIPELILMQDGSDPLPRQVPARVDVVLSPSGVGAAVDIQSRRSRTGTVLSMSGLDEGFTDRFAAATSLSLRAGGRTLLSIVTPTANEGVAALRQCNLDLMQSWGIDTAALASLQRRPRLLSGLITNDDYPAEALDAEEQGRSVLRLDVLPDGRVTNCAVLVSSGSLRLDERACQVMRRRARYEPALDAAGQAVPAPSLYTVVWRLPSF